LDTKKPALRTVTAVLEQQQHQHSTTTTLSGDGFCVMCGKTVVVVVFGSVSETSHGNKSLLSCLLSGGLTLAAAAGVFNTVTVGCQSSALQ